jgi:hypothetical protein
MSQPYIANAKRRQLLNNHSNQLWENATYSTIYIIYKYILITIIFSNVSISKRKTFVKRFTIGYAVLLGEFLVNARKGLKRVSKKANTYCVWWHKVKLFLWLNN